MQIHFLARTWLMGVTAACVACSDPGDSGATSADSGTNDTTEDTGDSLSDAQEAASCVPGLSIYCEAGAPDAQGCTGPPGGKYAEDASVTEDVVYPEGCEATCVRCATGVVAEES